MKKLWGPLLVCLVMLAGDLAAQANVPLRTPLQGIIRDNAGVPVVDDAFQVVFSLYANPDDLDAIWSESWPPDGGACPEDGVGCVKVEEGLFSVVLGSHEPLSPDLFLAGPLWLGMSVEGEPELPRRPLGSSPTAVVAAVSAGVSCTGCILAEHLAPATHQGIVDAAVSAVEDKGYATEEALANFVVGEGGLPAAGLNEISHGTLTNEFQHTFHAQEPLAIEDDWPLGSASAIVVPEVGLARSLTVSVDLNNSDISSLTLILEDPSGGEHVLWDGNTEGQALATSWPEPEAVVSGDLAVWIGQNPAGTWSLQVVDSGFLNQEQDGEVTAWSVSFDTLASDRVHAHANVGIDGELVVNGPSSLNGDLQVDGAAVVDGDLTVTGGISGPDGLTVNGRIQVGAAAPDCDPSRAGSIHFDAELQRLVFCDGTKTLVLQGCDVACKEPSEVACGESITNGCGDPCDGEGTALDTTGCLFAANSAACGSDVVDACGNACGLQGSALDPTTCPDPATILCSETVVDACGNGCGTTGTALNEPLCPQASEVACGLPLTDTCNNPCGGLGVACPGAKDACQVGGCAGYGTDAGNPGLSCKDILDSSPGIPSGQFFVDRDGPGGGPAIEVFCDMETEGGGWMLVDIGYLKDVPLSRTTNSPGGDSAGFVNGGSVFYGYPNNHDYEVWYDFDLGIDYTEILGEVTFYPSKGGVDSWTTSGAHPDNDDYGGISGDIDYDALGVTGEGSGNKSWHRWGKPGQVFHAPTTLGWSSEWSDIKTVTYGPSVVTGGSILRWSGFSESGDPPNERWAFSLQLYIR